MLTATADLVAKTATEIFSKQADLMRGFAWHWYGLCVDCISVGLGNGRVGHRSGRKLS